jgi:polyphosphate glucokinase
MEILGVDIGGSGIKGAPVDLATGNMLASRQRIPTPEPSKPQAVAKVVAEIARGFSWQGPIGCGFPAPIRGGVALTAANVHKKWVGTNVATLIAEATGCPVCVINDADAAGLAEMTFGAGRDRNGVVMMVTIGTGLGTALFVDHHLVPNTELGHVEIEGQDAEWRASDAARKRDNLSWKKWARRFNLYLTRLERLFWPDLFILGGGTSKEYDSFREYLSVSTEILPAELLNEAGIIGAALSARSCVDEAGS